ncbi:hypothetical protein J45TS6_28730 [Paenibacillus sp. J45TS6]|uniref:DUF3139 domain-containing protein n=1 Tax=unclassified Paenibacillus TaxID=185978 RepID=UPI001B1264C0|nr:DUF3139 domain-containing protein [Paenibacillus sp. J45TS6]GIP44414.1 hypothetical protein J45TS6_28730 [Paenibacillus sp. J45TS6]
MKKILKKIMLIGGGVVLGLVILVIGFIIYIQTPPKNDPEIVAYTEEKVKDYLVEEKGYSESDILHVTSKREPKNKDKAATGYRISVVFSNEPDSTYLYEINDEDEIRQFGYSTGKAIKHRTIK